MSVIQEAYNGLIRISVIQTHCVQHSSVLAQLRTSTGSHRSTSRVQSQHSLAYHRTPTSHTSILPSSYHYKYDAQSFHGFYGARVVVNEQDLIELWGFTIPDAATAIVGSSCPQYSFMYQYSATVVDITYLNNWETWPSQQQSAKSKKHILRYVPRRPGVSTHQPFGRCDSGASNQNDRYGQEQASSRIMNIDKPFYIVILVVGAMQLSIHRSTGTRSQGHSVEYRFWIQAQPFKMPSSRFQLGSHLLLHVLEALITSPILSYRISTAC